MRDATAFDAAGWMALGKGSARDIFPGTPQEVQSLYRKLVGQWHPDRNPDPQAGEVFVRLQELYEHAKAVASGKPTGPEIVVSDRAGRKFRFQAQAEEPFELGSFLRGKASLAYRVEREHADLFQAFAAHCNHWSFASSGMATQMAPLLPSLHACPWGEDGGLLVLKRDPEAIRLSDLKTHYAQNAQAFPAEHVAWIISGLFNLACYLEHIKVAHQAILMENVWVVPERHSVHLWGGWFYARPFGERLTVLPSAAADMASHRYLENRVAGLGLDRSLIRALGRELLGDRSGQRLPAAAAPKPFVDALTFPSSTRAVEDYRAWKKVLTASFGPPTFVPMNVKASSLYA